MESREKFTVTQLDFFWVALILFGIFGFVMYMSPMNTAGYVLITLFIFIPCIAATIWSKLFKITVNGRQITVRERPGKEYGFDISEIVEVEARVTESGLGNMTTISIATASRQVRVTTLMNGYKDMADYIFRNVDSSKIVYPTDPGTGQFVQRGDIAQTVASGNSLYRKVPVRRKKLIKIILRNVIVLILIFVFTIGSVLADGPLDIEEFMFMFKLICIPCLVLAIVSTIIEMREKTDKDYGFDVSGVVKAEFSRAESEAGDILRLTIETVSGQVVVQSDQKEFNDLADYIVENVDNRKIVLPPDVGVALGRKLPGENAGNSPFLKLLEIILIIFLLWEAIREIIIPALSTMTH